jgi:hypothetical protein
MEIEEGGQTSRIERRRFLREAATVAWATPVIWTLMSQAAGAQSCAGSGVRCCDACSPDGDPNLNLVCITGVTTPCCTPLRCLKSKGSGGKRNKPCDCRA